MAKYNKQEVLDAIGRTGLIPVFNNASVEVCREVVKACYDGGVRLFEYTNRGDYSKDVFAGLVEYANKELPGMIVGIGSVVDPATASFYIQSGASFIVGPVFNPEISCVCNRRIIPYFPGCATVSEVGEAQKSGCDICKVFPGDVLRPSFIKALTGPMPWTRTLVTGMVELTQQSIDAWFDAGVTCVGMGTNLFPKEAVAGGDWGEITRRCTLALEYIAPHLAVTGLRKGL